MNPLLTFVGYSFAGVAFLVLLIWLLAGWRDRLGGKQLLLAVFVSVVWSAALAFAVVSGRLSGFDIFVIEIGADAVWLFFLSGLMGGALGSERIWLVRYGGIILAAAILLLGIWTEVVNEGQLGVARLMVMGSLGTALYGLVGVEQIYRNARPSQRNGLKFLGLGVGGIFGFDLFLYSDAIISGGISPLLWSARGYVVTLCVPLIAIAVHRVQSSSHGIFVSRQIVFYSTTLIGAGIYLTVVGVAGYMIRIYGKGWGPLAQLVFFSASVIVLLIVLMSEQARAKIRVFVLKHFFENKYDYREEWLRLINTLTSDEESLPLKKRAIQSLAQIIQANHGFLWLSVDDGTMYRRTTSWNAQPKNGALPGNSPLIEFISRTGWVLDMREVTSDPDCYGLTNTHTNSADIDDSGFVVPLFHDSELAGFVELPRPTTPFEMNFEDHDLLKTAGRQIASYLAQELSTEQLTESRQFEAFNRLTAYIMHDLKNIMAQQSLVVENAEKHRRNPEFVDDAIDTIKGSVHRMRKVLGHLQQGGVSHRSQKVELRRVLLEVVSQCDDRKPRPSAALGEDEVRVLADSDRLFMALFHAVRNSQDATDLDGVITIALETVASSAVIKVTDSGCGMDEEFIRERLFKPFNSTKGVQGMGIGAYQIRETIKSAGGELAVESVLGEGTVLTITLPIIEAKSGGQR